VSKQQRRANDGRVVLVPVPVEVALSYDGKQWRLLPAPPTWWLAEQQEWAEHTLRSCVPQDAPLAGTTARASSGTTATSPSRTAGLTWRRSR
jgi:hypothetical protein